MCVCVFMLEEGYRMSDEAFPVDILSWPGIILKKNKKTIYNLV